MNLKDAKPTLMAIFVLSVIIPLSSGFLIDSMEFKGDVSPGQKLIHEINVSSGVGDPIQNLTANIYGWAMTEDGAYIELSPEDDKGDSTARPFLSIEPKSFVLVPGKVERLNITGTVPNDVSPGTKYALVTIKTVPMPEEGNVVLISTAYQVLVILNIKGTDLIKTGEITDLSASMINQNVTVDLLFKNTGNTHYKPLVEAILKNENGKELAKFGPERTRPESVLPSNLRRFNVSLVSEEDLSPGKYTVEGKVSLEDGTVLDSKETEFEI